MIFTKLIKPKWQSTDPEVRKMALKEIDDPNIINEMAQRDESTAVRRAAIHKINDLSLLDSIMQHEADNGVREVALQRFKQLLAGQKEDNTIPLATRLERINHLSQTELLEYLVKQGQEAELRLAAAQHIDNQELLADIAINDPSSKVRLAAIERVNQQSQLEQVFKATRSRDKTVSRIAHDKLNVLIEADERPLKIRQECETLCARLEKLGRGEQNAKMWDQEQAEYKHTTNRWQTIDKNDIPQDLQTRFSQAQAAFTTALTQFETATRLREQAIAERLTKKQNCCQQAEELLAKLKALQEAQCFPSIEERNAIKDAIDHCKIEWKQLDQHIESEEEQQYHHQFEQLNPAITQLYARIQAGDEVFGELEKIVQRTSLKSSLSPKHIAHLIEDWQKQWRRQTSQMLTSAPYVSIEKQFNDAIEQLQQQLKAQKEQKEHIKQQLQAMETALNEGQLQTAITLEQQVTDKLTAFALEQQPTDKSSKQISFACCKDLEERLQTCTNKIRELRDWQNWGILLRRKSLCHLVESLLPNEILAQHAESHDINDNPTGTHPTNTDEEYAAVELSLKNELLSPDPKDLEDVARFIQNAQTAWKELGAAGYDHKLWERFNAACNQAYQPCQVYFESKALERAHNLAKKQEICEKLEALFDETDWDNLAPEMWKSKVSFINNTKEAWYAVGVTNKRDKKVIQKRFKDICDKLEARIDAERERNANERKILIEEAKAASQLEDIGQAINKVKSLQKQWQVTIPDDKRSVEQSLWKAFRQPCDSVFAKREQLKVEQEQAIIESFQQRALLCEQIEALSQLTGEAVKTIPKQLQDLQAQWQQIPTIPNQYQTDKEWQKQSKELKDRFTSVVKKARIAYPSQLARFEHEQFSLLTQKARLCLELEQATDLEPTLVDSVRERWTHLPTLIDAQLEAGIQRRFETACAGQTTCAPELLKYKETLCIRMEILAGVESPPEIQQARLEYQVMRLSEAMSGGEKVTNEQEDAQSIGHKWYLTGIRAPHVAELERRFAKACDAFYARK